MPEQKDQKGLSMGDLSSPEAIRAHVELLARHVPMTNDQMEALCQDPAALRRQLAALKSHQVMTDQQVARTMTDPAALRERLAEVEADETLSAQEKEALRMEYTWILKHLED